METYKFIINGLRHHDFKDKLDELYEFAPGHRMSISIEHDNAHEEDAVIVYLGSKCVGYVRSGADRKKVCSHRLSIQYLWKAHVLILLPS